MLSFYVIVGNRKGANNKEKYRFKAQRFYLR